MKMAFQQYKPSQWQYALGIGGFFVATISVIAIVLFYYRVQWVNASDYIMAVKCIGPGVIFALAFLPKKMLIVTLDPKRVTVHTEHRFIFFSIPFPKKTLPTIDYVCALCQLQSDSDNEGNVTYSYTYDVNAWYGNKHIKLCSQYSAEEAMRVATKLALALNCDLLDATDPDSKVWIEMPYKNDEVTSL